MTFKPYVVAEAVAVVAAAAGANVNHLVERCFPEPCTWFKACRQHTGALPSQKMWDGYA